MPIVLLIVAILLVVAAINNKMADLGELTAETFNPSDGSAVGFPVWVVAIFGIGSLGYIKEIRPVANAFLVLIIISIVLSNRGFFAQFNAAIRDI